MDMFQELFRKPVNTTVLLDLARTRLDWYSWPGKLCFSLPSMLNQYTSIVLANMLAFTSSKKTYVTVSQVFYQQEFSPLKALVSYDGDGDGSV